MKSYRTEDGKVFSSYQEAVDHSISLKGLREKFHVGYSVWNTNDPVVWVANYFAHGFYTWSEWKEIIQKYPEMNYDWEYCLPDSITVESLSGAGISTLEGLINISSGEHVGFKIEVLINEEHN